MDPRGFTRDSIPPKKMVEKSHHEPQVSGVTMSGFHSESGTKKYTAKNRNGFNVSSLIQLDIRFIRSWIPHG